MSLLANTEPAREGRQSKREQGVLEDLEIALRGRSRDTRVTSERGDVESFGVEERRDRQKMRESRKVPGHGLCLDFLLQIHLHVRVERISRRIGHPYDRESARRERSVEMEIGPELLRNEWMEASPNRATGEQVDAGPAELSRAGSYEDEPEPLFLDLLMDDVQESRHRWTSSTTTSERSGSASSSAEKRPGSTRSLW
jgi:hypothetical protein